MVKRKPLTRRNFLKVSFTASGSLLITSYLAGGPHPPPAFATTAVTSTTPAPTPARTETAVMDGPFEPNLLVSIDRSGLVTLTVYRSEMGQGVRTAMAMVLADELEADWSKVRVIQADANPLVGNNQITGGSGSMVDTYSPLREAGAKGRAILLQAAAQTWGVDAKECRAELGNVIHAASNKKLGYGELVTAAKTVKFSGLPPLKDPKEFRYIGKSIPRVDDPAIVTGTAMYGLDARVPNMLYATVARIPVPAGSLDSFDDSAAKKVPGVRQIVKVPSGIAVLADNTWAAIQGRAALQVKWKDGPNGALDSAGIRKQMMDLVEASAAAEAPVTLTSIEAVYETPYLAHAAMEPVNCIADVRADRCEIWAPTQNPQDVQSFVRDAIGLPTDVHVTLLGGGFGRRLEVDYAVEAARISKAAGVPVQVVWTREDDIQHDFYRQPTYHWMRAGWDADGKLGLWRHYLAAPGLNGVAYRIGREVLDEGLTVPYVIPNRLVKAELANVPLPTGPWRAVMAGPNGFANESFLDEVAFALKQDPYELRMQLLGPSDRMRPVLELAATKANWATPPAAGRARGIACHTYHATGVAMVAEVSVEAGKVRVHEITCALDCGVVIHPDIVAQQMEGGVAYALTALFKNPITFKQGRVEQSNFNDYPLLKMDEMPVVKVYTVPSPHAPQGVGEMGVPPVAPAVLNAVFALTGKRIRHTPIRAEDLTG